MSDKKVYFVPNRCLGCQECLTACAKAHIPPVSPEEASFEPRNFLLHVGIGLFPFSLRCAQCENPSCLAACPEEAITKNETGTVLINYEKCTGCSNCVVACPFGMMSLHPISNKPVKCDLCNERIAQGISKEPACVEGCALKALVFSTPEEIMTMKEKEASLKVITTRDLVKQLIIPKEA